MAAALLRNTFAGLALCLCCLTGATAMADDAKRDPSGPPSSYRLADVSLQATRHAGNAAFKPQRATLTGTGKAHLERDGASKSGSFAPKDLVPLLNELYGAAFFALPENLAAKHSVVLKDDGTVMTRILHRQDAASTSICFEADGYRKCVNYAAGGHPELEALAKRVFSEAEKAAQQGKPGK